MNSSIHVFIVDNEQSAIDSISKVLTDFFDDIHIVGSAQNTADAFRMIQERQPDLVFLDIEMGKESGFDLLEVFDEVNFRVVFLTAHEEYALKAIKFSAIDYIIKPAGISDLKQLFTKVRKGLNQAYKNTTIKHMFSNFSTPNKEQHKIALPIAEGVEFIKVDDILYIRADGSYTHFYLKNKENLTVSKNLKFFESILTDYGFFRIHNSTLVNLKYIKKIGKSSGGYVVMEDNEEFSISKSRKEEFSQLFSV